MYICFQPIFQHIAKIAQEIQHMCFFLKSLKIKTSPFGRTRKAYILKFRHIDLAIGGDIHFEILGQCTCASQPKDPTVGFVKK